MFEKFKKFRFQIIAAVIAADLILFGAFFFMPFPGTVPVLMYHFIGNPADNPYSEGNFVSEKDFEEQMSFLKTFGYRVISMDDYYAIMTGAQKPRGREVVITFDDGDHSFNSRAVPILKRYGFPVTVFLVSDLIQTGENGSMKLETILKLQQENPQLDFQSHTKTHAHLTEIPEAQLKDEMESSRKALSEMLGKDVRDLAYPYGQFNRQALEAARQAGYRMAFTTGHKRLNGIEEGLWSRTRLKVDRVSDHPIGFWYNLSGIHQMIKGTREKFRNFLNPR